MVLVLPCRQVTIAGWRVHSWVVVDILLLVAYRGLFDTKNTSPYSFCDFFWSSSSSFRFHLIKTKLDSFFLFFIFYFLKTHGLELTMWPWMASNWQWFSCLAFWEFGLQRWATLPSTTCFFYWFISVFTLFFFSFIPLFLPPSFPSFSFNSFLFVETESEVTTLN